MKMKTRLIFLMWALLISVAATGAQAASTNYAAALPNDDGSVTILNPKFKLVGREHQISGHSDLTGVCALYGYAAYVTASALSYGDHRDPTVLIATNGTFVGFYTYGSSTYNTSIESLICTNSPAVPYSQRYIQVFNNDDGTVTILGPRFGLADGHLRWLSAHSDPDGICRNLYGYGAYVQRSRLTERHHDRTVIIGASGKFFGFVEESSVEANRRIFSLACRSDAVPLPVLRHYSNIVKNDDGTFTVLGPMFGSFNEGLLQFISSHSDYNGVCRHFGFTQALPGGALISGFNMDRYTVLLNDLGTFAGFYDDTPGDNYKIESIVCR